MTNENYSQSHNEPYKSREITLFQDNGILTFIYEKVEKISCAVYLVTNNFPDKEPLRWNIRDKTLSLLGEIVYLRNSSSDDSFVKESLSVKILEIVSLLGLSFRAGLLSEMNHEIIKRESLKLNGFISSKTSLRDENRSIFEKDFFEIPSENLFRKDSVQKNQGEIYRNSVKDISIGQDKRHLSFIQNKKTKGLTEEGTQQREDKLQPKTETRRVKILAIVRSRGDVSIKDVVKLIKEYSEKTLQRDLVSMVKEGILKKTGERRWSRYSTNI